MSFIQGQQGIRSFSKWFLQIEKVQSLNTQMTF